MRPNDMQADVVREIGELLADPDLDAEELGLAAFTLARFIDSGLVTESDASAMLADRIWRATTW